MTKPIIANQRLRGRKAVERRKRWLQSQPLCVQCEAEGVVQEAEEVDHIVPLFKGGPDDDTNLQSLCATHHLAKTAIDLSWNLTGGCDSNGYPTHPTHHWNEPGRGGEKV